MMNSSDAGPEPDLDPYVPEPDLDSYVPEPDLDPYVPEPDPLVRGTDPDLDPSIIKQKE